MRPNFFPELYGLKTLSVAGDYSFYYFKSWKILLDCGIYHPCYSDLRTVILSHAHMDHFGALFQVLSRNEFLHRPPLQVYGPGWIFPFFERIRTAQEFLNDSRGWTVQWNSFEHSVDLELGNNKVLRAHRVEHRQPAYCLQIFERRTYLKHEFQSSNPATIKRLRKEGVEIQEARLYPLLFYSGDSNRNLLQHQDLSSFETVVLETTFFEKGLREKAFLYGHIHFEDILEAVERFSGIQNLILTHFSARTSKQQLTQAYNTLRSQLPDSIALYFNTLQKPGK